MGLAYDPRKLSSSYLDAWLYGLTTLLIPSSISLIDAAGPSILTVESPSSWKNSPDVTFLGVKTVLAIG